MLSWGFSLMGVKTKLVIRKDGVRFHRRCVTEEHLSLISEPGSAYFWSYYTQRLFSACYRSSIIEYLTENHISAEKLLAVGCDGTNENTGRVGGVITLLEQEVRKPLV